MDLAIDQNHWDLFAVGGHEFWIIKQGELLKPDIRLTNDLADHLVGAFAQVAPWPADQGDLYFMHNPQPPFVPSSKERKGNPASQR